MKKSLKIIFSFALVAVCAFTFAACGLFGSDNFMDIKKDDIESITIQEVSFDSYRVNLNGPNYPTIVDSEIILTEKADWEEYYDAVKEFKFKNQTSKAGAAEDASHIYKTYSHRMMFKSKNKTIEMYFKGNGNSKNAIFFDGKSGFCVDFSQGQKAANLFKYEKQFLTMKIEEISSVKIDKVTFTNNSEVIEKTITLTDKSVWSEFFTDVYYIKFNTSTSLDENTTENDIYSTYSYKLTFNGTDTNTLYFNNTSITNAITIRNDKIFKFHFTGFEQAIAHLPA